MRFNYNEMCKLIARNTANSIEYPIRIKIIYNETGRKGTLYMKIILVISSCMLEQVTTLRSLTTFSRNDCCSYIILNTCLLQSERILSFIPPDGNFRLMSYHIGSQSVVAIPIYVRHNLTLRSNGDQGRLDLTVGPKQTMGRVLESK